MYFVKTFENVFLFSNRLSYKITIFISFSKLIHSFRMVLVVLNTWLSDFSLFYSTYSICLDSNSSSPSAMSSNWPIKLFYSLLMLLHVWREFGRDIYWCNIFITLLLFDIVFACLNNHNKATLLYHNTKLVV